MKLVRFECKHGIKWVNPAGIVFVYDFMSSQDERKTVLCSPAGNTYLDGWDAEDVVRLLADEVTDCRDSEDWLST